ncbi:MULTISPECIES: NAD(P)H-dependent oxidoreductase [unclassified Rhizobium]|uniref:NADPH-dependent FMN reductase n=1 Tax=unclassified Rhizobium TaxID=2613769 RepID=UPI0006FC586D|nr:MULTISPECIES: NAD(P)H-dependent oxidoreductase [unclassified Rhizobium]KQV34776.1 FMN reductase [Rhizobium sp. Root1212]KRD24110.1 FMN reductase [Rhizobium sp. Root268]
MTEKLTIAVIYGSVREGRFCDTVANWVLSQLEPEADIVTVLIDPADRRVSAGAAQVAYKEMIERADAFIVVTPEYNHGYPAALKELIDSCYQPWHAKPLGFVSYGGISGGLRAVEQLRQVFAELHVVTVRDGISLAYAGSQFDENGTPRDAERLAVRFGLMLRQIRWWAAALKTARKDRDYRNVTG